jgi:hypothetical protein
MGRGERKKENEHKGVVFLIEALRHVEDATVLVMAE